MQTTRKPKGSANSTGGQFTKHAAAEAPAVQPYIRHEDLQDPDNGVAIFGPFTPDEMTQRLNDTLADLLADSGDVDEVLMTDEEAATIHINTRQQWMDELARIESP